MPNLSIYVNHEIYQALSEEMKPSAKGKKIIEEWFNSRTKKEQNESHRIARGSNDTI